MLTVKYEIREDDSNRVVEAFERTFDNEAERQGWEHGQQGHPFLHLKVVGVVTVTQPFAAPPESL